MKPRNNQKPTCGQRRTVVEIDLPAEQVTDNEDLIIGGGQADGADREFQILVWNTKNVAHVRVYISFPSSISLSICPPSSKQPKTNDLRADRCKNLSVRHLSASVRRPRKRKVPGFWTVRERVFARGLEPRGGWIGGATCAAMNGYQKRWLAMPRAERISHYERARDNGEIYLFPDAWLDLLDAAIDRVYFKTPIPEGIA